jgi:hypothetical protein
MKSSVCWTSLSSSEGTCFYKSSACLNCVIPVDIIFLYSYESEIIQYPVKDNKIQKLMPLISLPCIVLMLCPLIIQTLVTGFHQYTTNEYHDWLKNKSLYGIGAAIWSHPQFYWDFHIRNLRMPIRRFVY